MPSPTFSFVSSLAPLLLTVLCAEIGLAAPNVEADVPERPDQQKSLPIEAIPINDFIYKIEGLGALFLINTSEGSVLVDTGYAGEQAAAQKALVLEHATGPIRKIIVTHAHIDHVGGLPLWKDEIDSGTEFIAHHRFRYMARIQQEPLPYFKRRFHAIYPDLVDLSPEPPRPAWKMPPTREVYPGQDHAFELGGVQFVVIAPENGGEGEDGLLLWLPESRVLFTGDLFGPLYPMFPNLYTVRGEKYRDPLDYIDALDLVLELRPKVIGHGHFRVIQGEDYIQASVKRMRDAVQFVWDETVQGMNAGNTVWELMGEIELPKELRLSQGHGKVSWSVRAIWELLAGWYHYDSVANLYHVPPTAINADLVELVGGADILAERAERYLEAEMPLEALRLLDIARGRESRRVLEARIRALDTLLASARAAANNHSEIGLLQSELRASKSRLEALGR